MDATYSGYPCAKLFYHPIDAALRWCNLMAHERDILHAVWQRPALLATLYRQWPELAVTTEMLFDAVRNDELPYGSLGVAVPRGTRVDEALLTIRHGDLKRWMTLYHPDQHPPFLFGSASRPQETVSLQAYQALQADRDALQLQLKHTQAAHQQLLDELKAVGLEREALKRINPSQGRLSERCELTYHRIIGALVQLLLGRSPAGKPYSVFESQAAVVCALVAHHPGVPGLTKRTLDQKFALGKRSLMQR